LPTANTCHFLHHLKTIELERFRRGWTTIFKLIKPHGWRTWVSNFVNIEYVRNIVSLMRLNNWCFFSKSYVADEKIEKH
jgi:hypothetical protein